MFQIYGILKGTELVYIGQTVQGFTKRWSSHLGDSRNNKGSVLGKAIRKHGEKKFYPYLLDIANSQAELCKLEKYYIALYKPRYNVQVGGKVGFVPWNKGRTEDRPEVIARISISAKNRKRTKRGKYSLEHCKKLSNAGKIRQAKAFKCNETNQVWNNKIDCANELNLNPKSLVVLLSGKTRLKTLKGFSFTYI